VTPAGAVNVYVPAVVNTSSPDGASVVTEALASDAEPVPTAFVAVTVNV
jgi:hypothetical protein